MDKLYTYNLINNNTEIEFLFYINDKEVKCLTSSDLILYNSELSIPIEFNNILDNYELTIDDIKDYFWNIIEYNHQQSKSCKNCRYNLNYKMSCLVLYIIEVMLNSLTPNDKKLYIMFNQDGLVKIGISKDPDKRKKQLQFELKEEITIYKVLDYANYEYKLHKVFHEYNARYKGSREWFTPYPKLINFIDNVDNNNFLLLYEKLKK